ncbi:MAG: response regulator transcription factor [Roseiarcus sp.]|jgi:DNA-binding response OmpR family regulator
MRALVVEDETKIAAEIAATLSQAGYVVETVGDGEEAWLRGETEDFDGIILDLGLPKLDGLSVVRNLRAAAVTTPILILTARGAWTERVAGIDAGADDYLPKPFQPEELLARLGAIIRRSAGHTTPMLETGVLRIDTRRMVTTVNGAPIALSSLEFRALRYLVHNKGRPVSQSELGEHVYGAEQEPGSNALEVLVARLRKKIGAEIIETQRGYGYLVRG